MVSSRQFVGIAFDLDGTLVDSVSDLRAAINIVLGDFGVAAVSDDKVATWVGNGIPKLVSRALEFGGIAGEHNANGAQVTRFYEAYHQTLGRYSVLYPGVADVLAALHASGIKLAVVTNKAAPFTNPLLAHLGIAEYFDQVLCADQLPKTKPDPYPLNLLSERWQLAKHQILMVGDSRNDILAAQRAGIRTVGLTYGYNYDEDIALSNPDWVCDHFTDLKNLILD